ncbi:MAG: hypothetical protein KRP56_01670 [Candidatus Methanogranum gryphiswaldense]|nr:MAG: hypothetical protein KRP56_01670 [Candidatus Methanogranum sp. U3.2.1]
MKLKHSVENKGMKMELFVSSKMHEFLMIITFLALLGFAVANVVYNMLNGISSYILITMPLVMLFLLAFVKTFIKVKEN